ncbi:protein ACCELERATED CELL DEATH 6-like [Dendrobium catenatum]|uniref:protein ACCELERATED CELL DEATH 6-like n=1 Tax=Dendrobium catenatum TaxID=906689 RepID=UPI00109F4058|nr:protein ACCELERATED CELL DEATH 6-like [Dendrobium catenatum]
MHPSFLSVSAMRANDMDRLFALLEEDRTRFYGMTVKGNTILHIAASLGNGWLIVEAYNNSEWDLLLHQNLKGDTILHCAARAGHDRILSLLIDHEELRHMTGMQNRRGDSALHEAARGGHAKVVRQLLAVGENMASMINGDGESPLYLAAVRGSLEIVEMLLGCVVVDYRGPRGQTALHAALIAVKSSDAVKMLLDKMPELNLKMDNSLSSPIHYAASLGDVNMVRLLLQADATIAHLLDDHGLSAIHIAASKDYANVIDEILHRCPDANELTDINGNNFIHVAAKKRATTVVKQVLSNPLLRQSTNEINHQGNTPLHLAAMNCNREIVHLLLSYSRVDTNVINRKGLTPLDIASSCANSNIRLRMKNMCEELTSAGSKFGAHRMDILMGKDQRRPEEELNRYRTLASNMAIVAVLITTVTFAAAFTLPGGYINDDSYQEEGMAILAKKLAFKLFLISDTISMLSSICVTCLLICSSSLDHDIRLHSIMTAMKFMWVALGGMLVAFSMGIYVVLVSKCRWLAIFICGMVACVPFMACKTAFLPTFGFIKLVLNDRNQTSIKIETSIFKVNMHMPHWMVVDFVTPASSAKCGEPPL